MSQPPPPPSVRLDLNISCQKASGLLSQSALIIVQHQPHQADVPLTDRPGASGAQPGQKSTTDGVFCCQTGLGPAPGHHQKLSSVLIRTRLEINFTLNHRGTSSRHTELAEHVAEGGAWRTLSALKSPARPDRSNRKHKETFLLFQMDVLWRDRRATGQNGPGRIRSSWVNATWGERIAWELPSA